MPEIALGELVRYLDEYLKVREVPDEPNAVNGLQVENGSGKAGRIVAAVDATLESILAAGPGGGGGEEERGGVHHSAGTLLLVHHGLFWDGNLPVTGRRYRRVRALLDRDIALYSAHIPLDVHPDVGNNALLARGLGLVEPVPFDVYRGISIGVQGRLEPPLAREALVARAEQLLSSPARLIPGGPALARRIGIITGGAGGRIGAAREAGLDTYLTGEGAHHTYFDAMEFGVNVIYAGHYATETLGVKAMAAHLAERFGIPWEFHDHPTGM